MAFIRRPNYWLCFLACAAAFWITLRVVATPAAAARPSPDSTANPADLSEVAADEIAADEIRDPALERMIARFAREATGARLRQDRR
jgi:hypothetical protein